MDPIDLNKQMGLLVNLGGNTPDFDYAAFLEDEEINFLPEETSVNFGGTPDSGEGSSASQAAAAAKRLSTQKQRLERRGHTKSRRGCYNCKRRRIKCQETRPECGHCVKTGLKCEYPAVPQVIHQPQHQIPLFSLQDMRFFQHFLLSCFPHHPLGNESIWTREVPCLSQNYEYLMHAILGLAASDLMSEDPNLITNAMTHRLKAIKAIKKTLNDVPRANSFEEGNALMATCFALTFQSVRLDDGMVEYMTFCRGIVIVAIQMYCKGAKFIFSNFIGEDQIAVLQPYMEAIPPIRQDWVDMAVKSLRALEPLCTHSVERDCHKLLCEMAEALYSSSFLAYQILSKHYGWWMQIPHENFQYLVDPSNPVCTLLASHWIALKQIMANITEAEFRVRAQVPQPNPLQPQGDVDIGMLRWLKHLNKQVLYEHQQYNQWPLWVEAQLDRDITLFGRGLYR